MSWPQIVVIACLILGAIAYLILGALLVIASVGKQPTTPSVAVTSVVITAGLIWLVTIA